MPHSSFRPSPVPVSALITLLTDFGTADGYVAEMKGVLLSLAPGVTVLDVTHDVPPQDVDGGRLALARYWRRFPPGTVRLTDGFEFVNVPAFFETGPATLTVEIR